jgi:hypothetical protein
VDLAHLDDAAQLRLDLVDDLRRAGGHDRDARQVALVIGLGHRERLDVVAAAREEADDTRQHAGLVVDDDGEGVPLHHLGEGGAEVVGGVARGAGGDVEWHEAVSGWACLRGIAVAVAFGNAETAPARAWLMSGSLGPSGARPRP